MNEINAWGAYESGTTQTARRLDGGALRQRRPNTERRPARQPVAATALPHQLKTSGSLEDLQKTRAGSYENLENAQQQTSSSEYKVKSTHALFFGTDDVTSLKEKTGDEDVPEGPATKEPTFADAKHAKEWREMRDLARSVFHVYFTNNDCDDDEIAKMKQTRSSKKPSFLNKINGTMPWLLGLMHGSSAPNIVKAPILFMEASFRGIAQVFFQNNPLSGLLILVAMFVQSSRVAVHGIIAIVCGNLSGLFMGFDKSFLSCGLFGYNSFLVGLAIATFDSAEMHMGYNWSAAIGVIITSYFSSVLFVMLGKMLAPYKTPPFTLPFNISTLAFLLVMKQITRNEVNEEPLVSVAANPLTAKAFFVGSIRGVGQVFLANNIISGVLVLVGIMLCSRISAVAAFVGSLVGTAVAALVGEDAAAIENGLYGFNSSLTLTAMVMFYVPSLGSVSFGIVASVVTVFVQLALAETLRVYGLPFMTLPFCLAALVFIVIQGTTSNVISVPLSSMTTPEDHLKRVKRLSAGFDLLFGAIRSSSYKGDLRKSWKSVVGYKKGGTKRMTSVLEEYDEEVHGVEESGGFFNCCKQLFGSSSRESRIKNIQQSFRMSVAMKNRAPRDEKISYSRMFTYIDKNDDHEITKSQFEEFLRSFGLDDEVGLDFALEAFLLMDLDGSGDIDLDEFIAFAKISRHMPAIRSLIVKFFDFVDVNGDQAVEIAELDSACQYLNLPPISDDDRGSLNALCNGDDELEFDMIVNFVTIFKLKSIIKEYQEKGDSGHNLDESLRSSVRI
mmetsp:Transcript_14766/g.30256  ORF Transcript_14766/g.30256 Transcript_14766/m.30256 type:complete len:785 (-) Transcript_14766:94-2448(-)